MMRSRRVGYLVGCTVLSLDAELPATHTGLRSSYQVPPWLWNQYRYLPLRRFHTKFAARRCLTHRPSAKVILGGSGPTPAHVAAVGVAGIFVSRLASTEVRSMSQAPYD